MLRTWTCDLDHKRKHVPNPVVRLSARFESSSSVEFNQGRQSIGSSVPVLRLDAAYVALARTVSTGHSAWVRIWAVVLAR